VDHFNPAWNEPDVKPDDQFKKAMKSAGDLFEDRVRYCKFLLLLMLDTL